MDCSKNSGTPKSSILIGFSIINHPFWGYRDTPIFGNTQMGYGPHWSDHTILTQVGFLRPNFLQSLDLCEASASASIPCEPENAVGRFTYADETEKAAIPDGR